MKYFNNYLNRVRRWKRAFQRAFSLNRYFVKITTIKKCPGLREIYGYYAEFGSVDTAELLTFPVYKNAKNMYKGVYKYPETFVAKLENSVFCSHYNLVLCGKHDVIRETTSTMHESKYFDWRIIHQKPAMCVKGVSTPLRSVSNNYYHVLIDLMPRLYALNYYKEVVNVVYSGNLTDTEMFWISHILPDSANLVKLQEGYNYKLEKYLYLPFVTQQFSGLLPDIYIDNAVKAVLPDRASKKCNRIYISRKNAHYRRVLNESQLMDQLKLYGFKRHYLENMSISDQIELFYDAEIVISAHGAGLTNMIYARDCDVLEIFAMNAVKPSYYTVTKPFGHRYAYICSNMSWINDDFEVDVAQVIDYVESLDTVREVDTK